LRLNNVQNIDGVVVWVALSIVTVTVPALICTAI